MKGLGGTLFLLLLVAGLGGAWWFTRDTGTDDDEGTRISEPLLGGRSVFDALRIRMRNGPGLEPIVMEQRAGGIWELREPIEDRVSPGWFEGLAGAYDTAQVIEAFDAAELARDPALLDETGLPAPRAEITFWFPDRSEPLHVEIGETSAMGDGLFLRIDGGAAAMQGGLGLFTALQVNINDLRDRRIFATAAPDLRRLSIQPGGGERIVLEGDSTGSFRLVEPVRAGIDPGALGEFLGTVLGARIDTFLAGAMNTPAEEPEFVVQLEAAREPRRETLQLWRVEGRLVGRITPRGAAGLDFGLRETTLSRSLQTPISRLRSSTLVPISVDEIDRLTLERPDAAPLAIERVGRELRLQRPVEVPMDPTALNVLLTGIAGMKAEAFVEDRPADLAKYGLAEGQVRLRLETPLRREGIELHFGAAAPEGGVYARRTDEDHVVRIEGDIVEAMRRPWTDYVSRKVLGFQSVSMIGRLILRGEGGEAVFERRDMRWYRAGGDDPLPRVAQVVEQLADLRAWKVHDPAVLAPNGPSYELVLEGPLEGSTLRRIQVYRHTFADRDPEAAETLLVRLPDLAVLFELYASAAGELRALLP